MGEKHFWSKDGLTLANVADDASWKRIRVDPESLFTSVFVGESIKSFRDVPAFLYEHLQR